MKNDKNQKNLKIEKCRYCGKEYVDVGPFSDENLMVPDCECQKVNSAIDRKIKLNRWIKLHYRVSPSKVCIYCGYNYQEKPILIGKTSFTYAIKPRCDCNKKIKVSIHKGLVGYMLGALTLGEWTEGACANIIQSWSNCCDCRSERYGSLIDEIIDDIKTETGVEVESKGYGECKEALTFIRNSIVDEVNRCDREEGFPVQNEWGFLREMKNNFQEGKK